MIQHQEIYYSNHSVQELYDLVIDVTKYPEFIPWCTTARVIEEPTPHTIIAELVVTFSGISEKYTSRVESVAQKNNKAEINTYNVTGPFKQLNSRWVFSYDASKKKTKVDFYIEFEFASKLLQMMIGSFFEKACIKMLKAFEKRADEIY